MVLYPYVATLAVDGNTLEGAPGAVGQVFAKGDTSFTTPLTAVDANGLPVELVANSRSVLPSFFVDGHPAVVWKSGDWAFPLVTSEPVPGDKGEPGQPGSDGRDGSNVVPTAQAIATEIQTSGTPTNNTLNASYARSMGWAVATDPRWGIKGDGVTDDSAAINAMLQEVYSNGATWTGGVAYFPAATYICANVEMRSRVILRGAGRRATIFKAPAGSTAGAVFTLRPNAVQSMWLEDLEVLGVGNANQHGIHFKATKTTQASGGWWEGGMRNIHVSKFLGHQIWLEAGGDTTLPHQFLQFSHVYVARESGALRAFHQTGQIGQVHYDSCQFENSTPGTPASTDGENSTAVSIRGYAHTFTNCTFQNSLYGVLADTTSIATFTGCYWENVGRGILARNTSRMVQVNAGNFANTTVTDGSGYLFRAESASFISHHDTRAGGAVDKLYSADSNSNVLGSVYIGPSTPTTTSTGSTKQIAESGGTLTLSTGARTFLVNGSATTIITVAGTARSAGESVFLKAHGGSIILGQTGNISVGKTTGTLTLPADGWVQLLRVDAGGKDWVVVGASPA